MPFAAAESCAPPRSDDPIACGPCPRSRIAANIWLEYGSDVVPEEREPGWYDDPRAPGARRYWTGEEWTAPLTSDDAGDARDRGSIVLPAFWIIAGAVGLWLAQTYKPSASNQLGLNDNSFYLRPGTDHLVTIASILVIVLGAIRTLVVLTSR
jgi:hypothetical protein